MFRQEKLQVKFLRDYRAGSDNTVEPTFIAGQVAAVDRELACWFIELGYARLWTEGSSEIAKGAAR